MGRVYEAEERLSKRRVALKVLRPELTRSEEGRRFFLGEMQILASIEHPNLVRSLATCEVDGQLVMALEFVDGRTLREELADKGRLAWPEAVRIAVAVAEGLSAAHGHEPPVVHRDLEPENVMLGAGGVVKVMDFGVAKVVEDGRSTARPRPGQHLKAGVTNTQSVGTLQYMSPEQIDAKAIDARSDLYALGLVLYECLAGAPPFRSASPRELLNMHCAAQAPALPEEVRAGMPAGVEDVLYAMLEKAPASRPESAREVVSRLRPFAPASLRAAKSAEAAPAIAHAVPAAHALPRQDTVALVERATGPRSIPTPLALMLTLLLSIAAGLTARTLRTTPVPTDAPARPSVATAAGR
jgi:eukaryotic-like serine/threonine-protein kinase